MPFKFAARVVSVLLLSVVVISPAAWADDPGTQGDGPSSYSTTAPDGDGELQPTWQVGGSVPGVSKGAITPDVWGIGADGCYGEFLSPDTSTVSGATFTAFQDCSASVAQQIGLRLYKCVRVGGPDDFDCTSVAARLFSLSVGYTYRADLYYACSHSASAEYQLEAYYIMANYIEISPVWGPIEFVQCG